MATGTSVVGSWQTYVDWGCSSPPIKAGIFNFKADGTWSYPGGGGRWIQVEGMVSLIFNNTNALVYTANITRDAGVGLMGYLSDPSPLMGCWYMTRVEGGAPKVTPKKADAAASREADVNVGPQR